MRWTLEDVYCWLFWHFYLVPLNVLRTIWFRRSTGICDFCQFAHPFSSMRTIRYIDGSVGDRCHECLALTEAIREAYDDLAWRLW